MFLQPHATLPPGVNGTPGGYMIALAVEDIHATMKELKEKGVEITTDIVDIGAGLSFFAKDPDGHLLDLFMLYSQTLEGRAQLGFKLK